jgi:uncharacterized OsmC-like protein
VAGRVRSAKTREGQLRQQGVTGARAGREAAASVAGKPKQQQPKKRGGKAAPAPSTCAAASLAACSCAVLPCSMTCPPCTARM